MPTTPPILQPLCAGQVPTQPQTATAPTLHPKMSYYFAPSSCKFGSPALRSVYHVVPTCSALGKCCIECTDADVIARYDCRACAKCRVVTPAPLEQPPSPDYEPSSPAWVPRSPDYEPPAWVPQSPDYEPFSPAWVPPSPDYEPADDEETDCDDDLLCLLL